MTWNAALRTGTYTGSQAGMPWWEWGPTEDAEVETKMAPGVVDQLAEEGRLVPGNEKVVVYGHGDNGKGYSSAWMCGILARNGYRVLATTHPDKDVKPLTKPAAWTAQTGWNRHEDVRGLLDTFGVRTCAYVGHSLGALMGILMAGASPVWKDERVGAFLSWSGYFAPLSEMGGDGARIKVPSMLQVGGPTDAASVAAARRLIQVLPEPKSLRAIDTAGHLSWTTTQCSAYGSGDACVAGDVTAAAISVWTEAFVEEYCP